MNILEFLAGPSLDGDAASSVYQPSPPPQLLINNVFDFLEEVKLFQCTFRHDSVPPQSTHFKLSQCTLYSIGVSGGRFRIRRNVSRIRVVQARSVAVRFHTHSKSSGNFVLSTTPQISGPTRNCSPSIAIQTVSQARSILLLRSLMIQRPPFVLPGSSHIGLTPL